MNIQPSQLISVCPLCRATYAEEGIRLIGEGEGTRTFHCGCKACGHAMMAVILEMSGWISAVGMVTDMEAADALRFASVPSIAGDECVALHRQLEQDGRGFCERLMVLPPVS